MLYMTTHLPSLTRTLLLWSKEPEFRNQGVPVFDLLINPGKNLEIQINLKIVKKWWNYCSTTPRIPHRHELCWKKYREDVWKHGFYIEQGTRNNAQRIVVYRLKKWKLRHFKGTQFHSLLWELYLSLLFGFYWIYSEIGDAKFGKKMNYRESFRDNKSLISI